MICGRLTSVSREGPPEHLVAPEKLDYCVCCTLVLRVQQATSSPWCSTHVIGLGQSKEVNRQDKCPRCQVMARSVIIRRVLPLKTIGSSLLGRFPAFEVEQRARSMLCDDRCLTRTNRHQAGTKRKMTQICVQEPGQAYLGLVRGQYLGSQNIPGTTCNKARARDSTGIEAVYPRVGTPFTRDDRAMVDGVSTVNRGSSMPRPECDSEENLYTPVDEQFLGLGI